MGDSKTITSVVDMSWLMHRYKNALKELSAEIDGRTVPTGHVYGSLKFIDGLSRNSDRVILCFDSHMNYRKEDYPAYKANRHAKTGNDFADYDIHQDTENIVKLCSQFGNVFCARKDGYEADDIIASYIRLADQDWRFYFRDDDILQTKGDYTLCVNFEGPLKVGYPVDRSEHLKKKYGIDLDFLPIIWKVVRGDAGDNIPVAIPRFPTKLLVQASYAECYEDDVSFHDCLQSILQFDFPKSLSAVKDDILNEGEFYKALKLNFILVKPRYIFDNMYDPRLKMRCSDKELKDIYSRYNMKPIRSIGIF